MNILHTAVDKFELLTLQCTTGCGGEMKSTGWCQPVAPPNYKHRCDWCGHEEWIRGGEKFPQIIALTKRGEYKI